MFPMENKDTIPKCVYAFVFTMWHLCAVFTTGCKKDWLSTDKGNDALYAE